MILDYAASCSQQKLIPKTQQNKNIWKMKDLRMVCIHQQPGIYKMHEIWTFKSHCNPTKTNGNPWSYHPTVVDSSHGIAENIRSPRGCCSRKALVCGWWDGVEKSKRNQKHKNIHHPQDHWTLKTVYFEDPTPAIQVQTLPLEGPRSLGHMWFNATVLSPTWGSHKTFQRVTWTHHPKKVTTWITRYSELAFNKVHRTKQDIKNKCISTLYNRIYPT